MQRNSGLHELWIMHFRVQKTLCSCDSESSSSMKGLPNMVAGQYGTAYLVSWDEEKCGEERRALNGSASSASSAFARPDID